MKFVKVKTGKGETAEHVYINLARVDCIYRTRDKLILKAGTQAVSVEDAEDIARVLRMIEEPFGS